MACRFEGTFRAHQVPLSDPRKNPQHLKAARTVDAQLSPRRMFDESGRLVAELAELAPVGERRMGANPHANGGLLLKDLSLPEFESYAVNVKKPGATDAEDTHVLGTFLRDVIKLNAAARNFRIFSGRTRPCRTGWGTSFRRPSGNGMRN